MGYKVTNRGKKKLLKRVLGKRTVGLKRTEIELKNTNRLKITEFDYFMSVITCNYFGVKAVSASILKLLVISRMEMTATLIFFLLEG